MVKTLFENQKSYINFFFEEVDMHKTQEMIELFYSCRGAIIFTGVGKSGIIANKLAMTMLSTGTKSYYLPPINALHGDIGIVGSEDVFVFLSKTGETQELLNLLPFVRKKRGSSRFHCFQSPFQTGEKIGSLYFLTYRKRTMSL